MFLQGQRHASAFLHCIVLVSVVAIAACDPSEDPGVWQAGPTFLIVAPAAAQPPSREEGTALYIQARGGSFVSIVTYGGKHRHASLIREASASCAELPGNSEPLYFVVRPDERECVVEARLYADCDIPPDAGAALGLCGSHDAFIASAVLSVASRRLDGDASKLVDAAREADR